jgi:hypothetical protein
VNFSSSLNQGTGFSCGTKAHCLFVPIHLEGATAHERDQTE